MIWTFKLGANLITRIGTSWSKYRYMNSIGTLSDKNALDDGTV